MPDPRRTVYELSKTFACDRNESDISQLITFLRGAVGGALALSMNPAAADAGAGVEPPSLTLADIDRMMTELSNWGRWGKDDQMGTVNLITPAKRKQAASLVREGTTVSLAHDQDTKKFPDNPLPLIHVMEAVAGSDQPGFTASRDTYTMTYHGTFYSHMDALCHFCYNLPGRGGSASGTRTAGTQTVPKAGAS